MGVWVGSSLPSLLDNCHFPTTAFSTRGLGDAPVSKPPPPPLLRTVLQISPGQSWSEPWLQAGENPGGEQAVLAGVPRRPRAAACAALGGKWLWAACQLGQGLSLAWPSGHWGERWRVMVASGIPRGP